MCLLNSFMTLTKELRSIISLPALCCAVLCSSLLCSVVLYSFHRFTVVIPSIFLGSRIQANPPWFFFQLEEIENRFYFALPVWLLNQPVSVSKPSLTHLLFANTIRLQVTWIIIHQNDFIFFIFFEKILYWFALTPRSFGRSINLPNLVMRLWKRVCMCKGDNNAHILDLVPNSVFFLSGKWRDSSSKNMVIVAGYSIDYQSFS